MSLTCVENFWMALKLGGAQKTCIHEASQSNFEADFTRIFQKIETFFVFLKIKCVRCRTVLIQSAMCSPDVSGCFKYPDHVSNLRRRISGWLWSLVGVLKKHASMRQVKAISRQILQWFFKNKIFLCFQCYHTSQHVFLVVGLAKSNFLHVIFTSK